MRGHETVKIVSQSLGTDMDEAMHGMQPNNGKQPREVAGQTGQTGLS